MARRRVISQVTFAVAPTTLMAAVAPAGRGTGG